MPARVAAALLLLAIAASAPQLTPGARAERQPAAAEAVQGATGAAATPAAQAESPANEGAGPEPVASYTIDARLDPAARTLTGRQVLSWRNPSSIAATTLRFHLYYNAWRNTSSTWMRESRLAGNTTLHERPADDWSWIDVAALTIRRGQQEVDLTGRMRFISPDDGNPDDRTVLEVPLDAPIPPGESAAIRMTWSSRVPRTFARTGAIGNFFFVAQWFPKIGVLEDTGWNCHQFHAHTEFFANFGTYDVSLTVPRGWIVGATGLERERRDNADGTTTHRYFQDAVHDFAWTTSPDYLEYIEQFTHATLPAVRMRLLLQPEHEGQEARHFAATRAALKYYGEWYGPYPYGHVTIVDPAWRSGAGGMEYPTFFTAGTRWLAPERAIQPESVTVHEAGHQFWYGIVATNEFEHAWLDEGLNTFSTSRVLAQEFEPNYLVLRYFGGFVPWVFNDLPVTRATASRSLAAYRSAAAGAVQALPTWQYWPGTASATTYHKTALWLHTLERLLGWETLQRILSTYFNRWAFRHPSPSDFFAVANEASGQDLTWFFDQVYRSAVVFDYGVEAFRSESTGTRGYTGDGGSRAFTTGERGASYRTAVVVRRFGEGYFPVDVRVQFDDGQETRWKWDGRDRWKLFEIDRPVRARRADIDPDRVLMLDVRVTNNSALIEPAADAAAAQWALAWLIWLQDHLLTSAFLL